MPERTFQLEFDDLSTEPARGDLRGAGWAEVRAVLERYAREPGDTGAYVILSSTPAAFLQSTTCDGGFVLEYEAGARDRHYEHPRVADAALMLETFRRYFEAPEEVASLISWRPLELP